MLDFRRFLNTEVGRGFISVLLGIGLASLFRKACKGKECIEFNGPFINQIDGHTYKFGDFCYQYSLEPAECDATKKVVKFVNPSETTDVGVTQPVIPESDIANVNNELYNQNASIAIDKIRAMIPLSMFSSTPATVQSSTQPILLGGNTVAM